MRRTLVAATAALVAIPSLGLARANANPERGAQGKVTDAVVVAILELANSFDVETGQLAAERARQKEVREFGMMLARDHRAVRQQGRDLAARLKITPVELGEGELSVAHEAAMKKLRAATSAEFDAAFLQHEVAYHENMIKLTNGTLLPNIRNAELKAFVVKIAPAFEAHRAGADALAKRLADGRR
jgi:putative membrane protein